MTTQQEIDELITLPRCVASLEQAEATERRRLCRLRVEQGAHPIHDDVVLEEVEFHDSLVQHVVHRVRVVVNDARQAPQVVPRGVERGRLPHSRQRILQKLHTPVDNETLRDFRDNLSNVREWLIF